VKVIGESADGYLITASRDEIANLFGFYWASDEKYRAELKKQLGEDLDSSYGQRRGSLIGLTIHPSQAFSQLSWLRQRDAEFDGLCKRLRETADAIQNHKPLFDTIIGDKK
jgi:hypothetical protein